MKPTGIVRRIDDLGRVVMPKELRRTLRIREGDPLEVYVDGNSVILKKYASKVPVIKDFAQDYAKSLAEATGHIALVTDDYAFVAAAGVPQREYLNKPIPDEWIKETQKALSGLFDYKDDNGTVRSVAYSRVVDKDKELGIVALMTKDSGSLGELELKLTQTAADFFAKQAGG
jgi:AbrB family transcriptional regulator (stage V sporulation protein T)